MSWSDPRADNDPVDPIAGDEEGDDPDEVDVEENVEEAREGDDDAPPL